MKIKIKSFEEIYKEMPLDIETWQRYLLFHSSDDIRLIANKWHLVISIVQSRRPRIGVPVTLYNICFPNRNIEERPFLIPDWFVEEVIEDED